MRERWEQNEFLRFALLAYAQRNLGRDADARASWRTAMAGAGSLPANLSALTELCERWNWQQERIDLFSRIYQRDPQNEKVFSELADFYRKNGQTADLARVYESRCDANLADSATKASFAYFSLMSGSNLSRAHVLAREAYDAGHDDLFRTKVYAYSLLQQGRAGDAWRLIEPLPVKAEQGLAQTCLIRAALLVQRKDLQQARTVLASFDASSALPEELTLVENLKKEIEKSSD